MEVVTLTIVCGVSVLTGGILTWLVYRTPLNLSTDNAIHVQFAAKLKLMDWPSKMHQGAREKFRMKDIGVLGVALIQRLLRDRTSMRPMVLLGVTSAVISTLLIYFIASTYWSTTVGALASLLFLFCFWPHQIALMGGFHCLAQVFLLVSVLFFQVSEWFRVPYSFIFCGLAGVTGGMILFASASGRKFLPLFVGAFLYSQRAVIAPLGFGESSWSSLGGGFGFFLVCLTTAVLLGFLLALLGVRFFYSPVVTAAYHKSGPAWLNQMIQNGDKHSLDHYLKFRGRIVVFLTRFGLKGIGWFLFSIVLSRDPSFYLAQSLVLLGMLTVVVLFTAPNIFENLRGYFVYHYTTYNYSRFDLYSDYFKRVGRAIPKGKRGAGVGWLIRFFPSIIPFHVAYFSIALASVLLLWFFSGLEPEFLLEISLFVGLSISPIIYGEWTKAPQSSRAYFPALIGIILFIAYGCFQWEQTLSPEEKPVFWFWAGCAVCLSAGWNIWVFLSDVLPAKVLVAKLIRKLEQLGIETFYTYNTVYNNELIDLIPPKIKEKYQIEFIESLKGVKQGYVVVPAISSKSWAFEAYPCGIEGKDFDEDPLLMKLIHTKEIKRFSVASFKTFGTSRVWVNESEITTYRNYIIRDIKAFDRWLGRAWIIDAGKLQTYLNGVGAS